MTEVEVDGIPTPEGPGSGRLARATVGMAVGTTISRVTGVGRVVALTAALGGFGFADAYNLANTTPNIMTDIVIGGVLSATFVLSSSTASPHAGARTPGRPSRRWSPSPSSCCSWPRWPSSC